MSADHVQKLQLRDAIVGVYTGKIALCQVRKNFPAWAAAVSTSV